MIREIFIFLLVVVSVKANAQSYFDFYFKSKDVDGSFVIYNENQNSWIFSNETDLNIGTPPAATFHLFHTLLGLELGYLSTDYSESASWDGLKRYYFNVPMKQWSCHTNLDEALFYQTDWFFDCLAQQISINNYQYFLKRINYSNHIIDTRLDGFWNFSGLTVTPLQQIEFLKQLYHQNLPFQTKYQTYVYNQMYTEHMKDYVLRGYDAYTVYQGKATDWWIGVLEAQNQRYFFAFRIYKAIDDLEDVARFRKIKYIIAQEVFNSLKITKH